MNAKYWILSLGLICTMSTASAGVSGATQSREPASAPTEKTDPGQVTAEKNKDDFRTKVESELSSLDKQIDGLEDQVSKASGEFKKNLNTQLDRLQSQRAEISKKLDETSKQAGPAWAQMRSGLEKALGELKAGFRKAQDEFKAKKAEVSKSDADSKKSKE